MKPSLQLSSTCQGRRYSPAGKAVWTVHHSIHHTCHGHSPPAKPSGTPGRTTLYDNTSYLIISFYLQGNYSSDTSQAKLNGGTRHGFSINITSLVRTGAKNYPFPLLGYRKMLFCFYLEEAGGTLYAECNLFPPPSPTRTRKANK